MVHLTRLQRTNLDGFPKPGELIEIAGAHELEASDRAILNLLYQHAMTAGGLWMIAQNGKSRFPRCGLLAIKAASGSVTAWTD